MLVVVSYDVSTKTSVGEKRLRTIAKLCVDYGMRVQNSVFECIVDPAQWEMLKHELLKLYNEEEDSLRFYFLGANWTRRIEHHGTKNIPNLMSDALVI